MKNSMTHIAAATIAALVLAQTTATAAGPVGFAVNKATRIVHRVGHGFDRHIARPAHRVIVHHRP